jgi:pentatricopeptide repeat protein
MKKAFLIFQFLCCMAACFGQQKLQKADKLFNEMAYVAAVKAYELS